MSGLGWRWLTAAGWMAAAMLASAPARAAPAPLADACSSLARPGAVRWPDASTRIETAVMRDAQTISGVQAPAHCEVIGNMQARKGVDGQAYKIRFHLRLPLAWNGRFLFQGGGGSNGVLGDAMGRIGFAAAPGLTLGYAVLSQDSGHDNQTNSPPDRGGPIAFGFDPQARANYGHASLLTTARAAKAAIGAVYGRPPRYSYFAGCSKGGEEGMALAQRYPDEFDGVLAGAPGFSLPRAAVAEAWANQVFASLAASPHPTPRDLAMALSDGDLALVQQAVIAACDADDGLADGVIGAFERCTTSKVETRLRAVTCAGVKTPACLTAAQVAAVVRVNGGPRDRSGRALYSDWAWDAGIAGRGWRQWVLGSADGAPANNVTLGMGSLAAVFSTPPQALTSPAAMMDFVTGYDFDRDASKIYATSPVFTRSAWDDISARSPDLSGFRRRGGKMIVPHGVSDPVFSVNDTLQWWREVDARSGGRAAAFVRVFPVPGMNHCSGGPATDQFDAFSALVDWVERGRAPNMLLARAGREAPWPSRTRPLCAYPAIAVYSGRGDPEDARSFACRRPERA